jgi:preprotein translocase subunit YajC
MEFLNDLTLLMAAPEGAAGAGGTASVAPTLVTFGLVFLIFYFLIIRPQNKRQKETKAMLERLKKGDRVATIGGIRGTITALKDDTVVLKVDDNTKIQFSRSAISSVLDAKKSGGGSGRDKAAQQEAEEADAAEDEKADE